MKRKLDLKRKWKKFVYYKLMDIREERISVNHKAIKTRLGRLKRAVRKIEPIYREYRFRKIVRDRLEREARELEKKKREAEIERDNQKQ